MEDTYTHKDLANLCSVSETTIKSYRRKFPGFIPVLTQGKPIRFKKEAGEVCLKIRDCFEKGMSVRETNKVLKEHFKEQPVARQAAPRGQGQPSRGVVSEEYLEKFFATAGQMMQGMASLATAQARSAQRLDKLEKAVNNLIEIETRNSELFTEVIGRMGGSGGTQAPQQPAPEAPAAETKVRSRKIVNVKGPEGEVKSYTLEKSEETATEEMPPEAFLATPIVILNDQGEFLGVPGRLSLAGFVEALAREAEEGGSSKAGWQCKDDSWIFSTTMPGGDSHALHFLSTTTPRGNQVVLLDRLDVNGTQTTQQFLQEFFRQVKGKI